MLSAGDSSRCSAKIAIGAVADNNVRKTSGLRERGRARAREREREREREGGRDGASERDRSVYTHGLKPEAEGSGD